MVAGLVRRDLALQLLAGGVKIAKGIKNLVADELVIITKTFLVHDFVTRKHDRIIKRTAACQAHRRMASTS